MQRKKSGAKGFRCGGYLFAFIYFFPSVCFGLTVTILLLTRVSFSVYPLTQPSFLFEKRRKEYKNTIILKISMFERSRGREQRSKKKEEIVSNWLRFYWCLDQGQNVYLVNCFMQ